MDHFDGLERGSAVCLYVLRYFDDGLPHQSLPIWFRIQYSRPPKSRIQIFRRPVLVLKKDRLEHRIVLSVECVRVAGIFYEIFGATLEYVILQAKCLTAVTSEGPHRHGS